HLIGSDGHSRHRRPPKLADAYRQISRWAGSAVADRVCSTNGLAVLQGLPVQVSQPKPRRAGWVVLWEEEAGRERGRGRKSLSSLGLAPRPSSWPLSFSPCAATPRSIAECA